MAMIGPDGDGPPESSTVAADGRLRALGAALAEARRRVGKGAEFDLAPLHKALVGALAPPPAGAVGPGSGAGLLVLLDEATALVARLELEGENLRERGQAWARRRRADVSYAGVGRRR
jgi:hypothetical protein